MEDPDEILAKNAETYRKKNDDYGDSWRLAGETLSLWLRHAGLDEISVSTDPDTLNSIGLFTRRLDKLIRAFNAEFVVDELNFESTQDAHEDGSTYAAMHAALLAEQETVEYENDGTMADGREYPGAALGLHEAGLSDEQIERVVSGETTAEYELNGDEPTTEDDYDESLPVEPEYQEKYEELTEDDE